MRSETAQATRPRLRQFGIGHAGPKSAFDSRRHEGRRTGRPALSPAASAPATFIALAPVGCTQSFHGSLAYTRPAGRRSTPGNADIISYSAAKRKGVPQLEVPQFYFGLPNLCDPCAVLEKLRRLMFSLPLHGFALFNHNQETLFCSDYSGLRPIYAAQPHPKTLQPTHV